MVLAMVSTDGQMNADEANVLDQVIERCAGGRDAKARLMIFRIMREVRAQKKSFAEHARAYRTAVNNRAAELELALDWLILLAGSDGIIDRMQFRFLKEAASIFGISDDILRQRIAAMERMAEQLQEADPDVARRARQRTQRFSGFHVEEPPNPLEWAYSELQCNPGDNTATIKKHYREAVKKYHPDMFKGTPTPTEIVAEAERRFVAIQKAYDALMKAAEQGGL